MVSYFLVNSATYNDRKSISVNKSAKNVTDYMVIIKELKGDNLFACIL